MQFCLERKGKFVLLTSLKYVSNIFKYIIFQVLSSLNLAPCLGHPLLILLNSTTFSSLL